MMGLQGQSISLILSALIIIVNASTVEDATATTAEQQGGATNNSAASKSHLSREEFQDWLEEQERRVVLKIMEKIASPNDTSMQLEVKMAVARYLVNATFTAVTRRLETLKSGKRQSFVPETAELPTPPIVESTTLIPIMAENDTENEMESNVTTSSPEEVSTTETLVFKGEGVPSNDSSLPKSAGVPEGLPVSVEGLQGLPVSVGGLQGLPASATPEEQSTMSSMNETNTKNRKPLWEELLTFNFSAALMGGPEAANLLSRLNSGEGGGLLSRLNGPEGGSLLSRLTGGANNGSQGFFSRLNLTALGGGGSGGNLFGGLNLTALGGGEGGNGGNLFERLNLTALGGGDGGNGGNLFSRLNLTALGGGGDGGNLFSRLNLTALGGGGGDGGSLFSRLNLTALGGGGGGGPAIFSHFNLSSLRGSSGGEGGNGSNAERPALPFNLPPPPEGLFNNPPPPPKNDSVRLSQMFLGSQVEKLMGDISNSNLTGIVESTINIATPSTVGVLVNALLNIILCNPLDRFNGYCGVE